MGIHRLPFRVLNYEGPKVLAVGSGEYYPGTEHGPPLLDGALHVCVEQRRNMHDAFQQIGNLEHVEPICGSVQTFRLPSDFFDQVHFFNVFNSYPFGMSLLPWMEDHLGVVKPGGLVLVGNTHTPNLTWMDQIAPVFARRGFSAEQLAYWDPAKSELSARQRERFVKFMGSGVLNHITPGAVLVAFKKRKA